MTLHNLAELLAGLPRDAAVLGIDYGRRRIGIALLGRARGSPYAVLRRGKLSVNAAEVPGHRGAGGGGGAGRGAARCRRTENRRRRHGTGRAHALAAATGLPAAMADERYMRRCGSVRPTGRGMCEADAHAAGRSFCRSIYGGWAWVTRTRRDGGFRRTVHCGAEAEMAVPAPRSFYLPMRHGLWLAVDVYAHPGKRPTLLIATPVGGTRDGIGGGGGGAEHRQISRCVRPARSTRGGGCARWGEFPGRGLFRSPRERADLAVLADWIVAQPWSDGRIGSTGISYLGWGGFPTPPGTRRCGRWRRLLGRVERGGDNYWPGGILCTGLVATYERLMIGLDRNRKELLEGGTFVGPRLLLGRWRLMGMMARCWRRRS